MRPAVITLVLLLSADIQAEETATIDTPTLNGLAHGVSTYKMADGSRTEITWKKGRKHGRYRQVHSSGVVLEEGDYQYGQRSGEWTQRDAEGNKVGTDSYLLGLRHGVRERREFTNGKPGHIEFAHFVLGLRHGRALEREPTAGHPVTGHYVQGKRHGEFTSAKGDPAFNSTYVCGWQLPKKGEAYRVARPSACAPPEKVEVFARPMMRSKKQARLLQGTLCEASEVLQIPVRLEGSAILCRHKEPLPRATAYLDVWRRSHSATDVLRAFQPQHRPSMSIHGSILDSERKPVGFVEIVDSRALWSIENCLVDIERVNGRVEIVDRGRQKATPSYPDSILRVLTDVLAPKSPLLDTYSARARAHSDSGITVTLTPKRKHTSVRDVRLQLEFDGANQLALTAMSVVPWKNGHLRHRFAFHGLKGQAIDESAAGRVSAGKAMLRRHRDSSKYTLVGSNKLACGDLVW